MNVRMDQTFFQIQHSHLVSGGTAGLSLSLSYVSGMPFSVVFFPVNIPFYILSLVRMGVRFSSFPVDFDERRREGQRQTHPSGRTSASRMSK